MVISCLLETECVRRHHFVGFSLPLRLGQKGHGLLECVPNFSYPFFLNSSDCSLNFALHISCETLGIYLLMHSPSLCRSYNPHLVAIFVRRKDIYLLDDFIEQRPLPQRLYKVLLLGTSSGDNPEMSPHTVSFLVMSPIVFMRSAICGLLKRQPRRCYQSKF